MQTMSSVLETPVLAAAATAATETVRVADDIFLPTPLLFWHTSAHLCRWEGLSAPRSSHCLSIKPCSYFFFLFSPVSVPSRQTDTQTDRKARCHQFRNTVSLLESRDAIAPGLHGEKQRAGTQFFVRGENETLHLISSPFPASPDRDSKSAGAVLGKKGEDKRTNGTKKKTKTEKKKESPSWNHCKALRSSSSIRTDPSGWRLVPCQVSRKGRRGQLWGTLESSPGHSPQCSQWWKVSLCSSWRPRTSSGQTGAAAAAFVRARGAHSRAQTQGRTRHVSLWGETGRRCKLKN